MTNHMRDLLMAVSFASLVTSLAACTTQAPTAQPAAAAPAPDPATRALDQQIAQFAPTDLTADISALSANEREALGHLVKAAQVMDALFLEQVWAGNESMFFDLSGNDTPAGKAALRYFVINKGPWSRLDHNKPFVAGAPEKPAAGNYYPVNATKEEVEKWLASLPAAEKARATGFLHKFT